MTPIKTLITDAVRRFPIEASPAWRRLAEGGHFELDHIEPNAGSITTTDCLFDGRATIVLKNAQPLPVSVFGRFDANRAEVERIVIEDGHGLRQTVS